MLINRYNLFEKLKKFVLDGNGIVVGHPGVGKTFVLRALAQFFLEAKMPCVYLPIDKLGVETEDALKKELEIREDILEYLKKQVVQHDGIVGTLIIDAFDAARSEVAQKLYLSIVRRVIGNLKGVWNVVVSVRTYDAKKSEELIDLFPISNKNEVPQEYQIDEIRCRHFAIPKLTNDEVKTALKTITNYSNAIYDHGSAEFKEVLRIPFNIWLLEKLLAIDPQVAGLSSISSEVQLLGLFWKQRITDGPLGEEKRFILSKVSRAMVSQRLLTVRVEDVYSVGVRESWNAIMSSEILIPTSGIAQRVTYSHNILFDYAISVLLIEDEPDKCVEFILEDPARPLFLRPSLNFYFTRLWYTAPHLFWKAFWHFLPSKHLHLRLLARLLPTSVIAYEARSLEDVTPLLKSLEEGNSLAREGVLRLLQALRALNIERDELWIVFVERAAFHIDRYFAWDLATRLSDILDRALKTGDKGIVNSCGRIGRHLFKWIWESRKIDKDPWIDSLGSSRVLQLVTRTFESDSKASRDILEKVLNLINEEHFPIGYLNRLVDDLDKIWPHDPSFAEKIYVAVFGHYETSEETTNMGTPILRLSSTRRQDYHMCQYQLAQHFPHFLRAKPQKATETVLICLNMFIIARHINGYLEEGVKFEDLIEKFVFWGREASYLPDSSYIWDESEYKEEPIQMADELFKFMVELSSSKETESVLDSLLDIFSKNVLVAFFWRRLLATAASNPSVFAHRLFELCIAQPILVGNETLRELGLFLETSAEVIGTEKLQKIEEAILSLVNGAEDREFLETRRKRLLARIPVTLLTTEAAKEIRHAMEKAKDIPENRPIVKFTASSEPYTHEKWLRRQGADPERPENQGLLKMSVPLETFTTAWQNKRPTQEAINNIMPLAKETYLAITKSVAEETIINSVWTRLSECVLTISRGVESSESEEYVFSREVLLQCAKHELPWPDPEHDLKYNSASWSSAPRNSAAQGLPWLAIRSIDGPMLNAIDALSHDKKPSVRFLITSELWRLMHKQPDFFWKIIHDIAEKETNRVVLQAASRTIWHIVNEDTAKSTEVLDKLLNRISLEEDRELIDSIVPIIMWLYIVKGDIWANSKVNAFLAAPVLYPKSLKRATFDALSFISPRQLTSSEHSDSAKHAIDWLPLAIKAAASAIKELKLQLEIKPDEKIQENFREIYGIIDEVIMRLYFASQGKNEDQEAIKQFYFKIKPLLELVISFALEKDGLLIAHTAHYFMQLLNNVLWCDPKGVVHIASGVAESSKRDNYNFDPLAVKEVIELVEAILADYRVDVQNGESLSDLLNLLDIFAETGWPDALRLVWRLDEIFR